jgi:hypothetical protein
VKDDAPPDVPRFTDPVKADEHADAAVSIDRLQLAPGYVRWGLLVIDGLTIGGKMATPELLITDGPEDLLYEIVSAIKVRLGLAVEQQKNSQSPTTSHEAAGAIPISLTAAPVSSVASFEGAPV